MTTTEHPLKKHWNSPNGPDTRGLRVIGYVRVSTDKQERSGMSLEAQREKVLAFAKVAEVELLEVVEEVGSGSNLDRPKLQAVLERLHRGEAQGLVVAKLDRLSRNIGDLCLLLDEHFAEPKRGRRAPRILLSATDYVDTRSAAGRMMIGIMTTISQWERETISERTVNVLEHKKSLGHRVGAIPYGCELAADGVQLIESEKELRVIGRARAMRARGVSLRRIADLLAKGGDFSRSGKVFAANMVRRMVEGVAVADGNIINGDTDEEKDHLTDEERAAAAVQAAERERRLATRGMTKGEKNQWARRQLAMAEAERRYDEVNAQAGVAA